MKLIASDHNKVMYYNTETKFSKILHQGQGVYYGITWDDKQNLFLAVSSSLHLLHLNHAPSQVTGYIQCGSKKSEPILSSPHQILWKKDMIYDVGSLYITDTGRNRLTVFDKYLKVKSELKITDADWDKVKGVQTGVHINSIFIGKYSFFLLAHNAGKPSFYKHYNRDNFDLIEHKEVDAYMAHNIALSSGYLLICDSKRGTLIDGITNKVLWKSGTANDLTRGLCITDSHIIVGRTPYQPIRAERVKGNSGAGIWVLDRNTFSELDYITIPGLSHINEVRILDEPDYAHNSYTLDYRQFEAP